LEALKEKNLTLRQTNFSTINPGDDDTPKCEFSNEGYEAALSCKSVYRATQDCSDFLSQL